jgi:hypothetical protein
LRRTIGDGTVQRHFNARDVRERRCTVRGLLVVITVVLSNVLVLGQHWTPPRTPWGDPDLQGYWPGVAMLGVPLERPASLGDKATLTDEEFAQLPDKRRLTNANDAFFGESRDHWRDYGKPQHQTSLVVDPPNGRFPSLTPDGAKRTAAIPNEARGPLDGPANASPQARCISRGAFGSMLPIGNSSGNQIIQAPGVVVIRNEMIHETRIVYVDGRPHVGTEVLGYMGDSRGSWQGATLVVETTNFKDAGGVNRAFTRYARMTERFTRIDAKTLRYEVTVDDPLTWSKPWTVAFPLEQDPDYYLFEFGCHEGNYWSMRSMLGGARLADK